MTNALVITTAVGVGLLLSEVALRLVPVPGVQYDVSIYDDLVGAGLSPGATVLYRNDRGDVAKRRISSIGYLDAEHELAKRPRIKRIGFFGDSYTEARQVPLDDTYFRLIESDLADAEVQTLAFGLSGFSTLQSYLTCTKWAEPFDIDLVVYVFVENDPGDNVPALKGHEPIPYPVLTPDGFRVDDSFRRAAANRNTWLHRLGDRLTSRSLLFATISQRVGLLLRYGIKVSVSEADRQMATKAGAALTQDRLPTSNDLPSTWPAELRENAERVTEAIIVRWASDARKSSRDFAILYVPRAKDLGVPAEQQDSWKSWLQALCTEHGITFIDPTPELRRAEDQGAEIFYDHFTKKGHEVFAQAFTDWYQQAYASAKTSH